MKRTDLIKEEYRDADGYWIYLKPGWIIPRDAHSIVESTKRQARAKLADAVPCSCDECKRLGAS